MIHKIRHHSTFSIITLLYHINVNVVRLYKQGKERLYWEVFNVISKVPDHMPQEKYVLHPHKAKGQKTTTELTTVLKSTLQKMGTAVVELLY